MAESAPQPEAGLKLQEAPWLLVSLLMVADSASAAPPATAVCAAFGERVTAMDGVTATVTEARLVESATEATVMLAVHGWESEAGGA